jgi:hypothetical protein
MAEKITVNGVETTDAVAKQLADAAEKAAAGTAQKQQAGFIVGKTFELPDGRVIEIRAGEEPSWGETMAINRAMGPEAEGEDITIALLISRTRIKGGGILTPEAIRALPFSKGAKLLEAALGKDFLSMGEKILPPSSCTASAPNISNDEQPAKLVG